ncbi:Gamma-aminobutyric acid type B receptor subunit 1 [Eumeta japonica]|uniref:Gamma-aminobutyric acid type B receptor subunit 1 n=1 Tax=Eumeta variegata TaxID=151549 RepID=A0A4C1XCF0_EUMVA|nr:Gamma-aminobutyric acid type B receptor subunit 1 [Eumeta japonica]
MSPKQTPALSYGGNPDREGGKVPPDRTVVVNELRTVSLPLFACLTTLCAAGLVAAVGLIIFNAVHRNRRVIQCSHPACNMVMLCGCCVCLCAAVALGVDGRWVAPAHFTGMCAARAWLLATGFSLAYGAMFTKVWRVHRHTTKPKIDSKLQKLALDKSNASFQYLCKKGPRLSDAKIKERVFDGPQIRSLMADEKFDATMNNTELDAWVAFKDVVNNFLGNNKQLDYKNKKRPHGWKLYSIVGGLLAVDAALLGAWQIRDPLQRRVETFPLEAPRHNDDDVHIRPELEHCESEHNTVWLGVMYGYKGLVLVFGLFLAYETRSVKVRQINDSRYVGMSIYNVVVLCLITAPVSLVIASQQDASFAFVSLAIVFCCFLSMALIFVPKVIEVIRHPTERVESGRGSGSGSAPADEERYRELLKENEELQQLIAQKEERIRVLKLKLAEREAAAAGGVRGDGGGDSVTQGTGGAGGGGPGGGGVLADLATATSDYGTSTNYTRSSRASVSDLDFSESYL